MKTITSSPMDFDTWMRRHGPKKDQPTPPAPAPVAPATKGKDTLEDIKKIEWEGNHHSDTVNGNFGRIDRFVRDTSNSEHDRAEAVRDMGRRGMGLTGEDAGEGIGDHELIHLYLFD